MKFVPIISLKLPHPILRTIAASSFLVGIFSIPVSALEVPAQLAQSSSNLLPLRGIQKERTQPPEPYDFFQPSAPPISETSLNKIGLLKDVSATELTIRSINGNEETFPISSQLESLPLLSPGALVSFRLEQSQVAEVDIPVVKSMFEGTLVVIEKNVLGLVSAAGERKFAQLSPEKIASLDIQPGQMIQVLEFEGIQTKVICSPQSDRRVTLYMGEVDDAIQNF